jgi:hypothetical protein
MAIFSLSFRPEARRRDEMSCVLDGDIELSWEEFFDHLSELRTALEQVMGGEEADAEADLLLTVFLTGECPWELGEEHGVSGSTVEHSFDNALARLKLSAGGDPTFVSLIRCLSALQENPQVVE